ncbi:hypothetical protein [Helicobacter sp. 23-1045]
MKKFSIILMAFIFAGCTQPLAHYSIASTNAVPIPMKKGDYFEGESCVWSILGIPMGSLAFRESKAVADALQKASEAGYDADVLTNVTIEASAWSAILFGQACVKATGQAATMPKRKAK